MANQATQSALRTGLLVLAALLVVACTPVKFRGSQPEKGQIDIARVSLNEQGDKMVFDFYVHLGEGLVTLYRIGLYDIPSRTVKVLRAIAPKEYLSPSFSPDGTKLALIQFCWATPCAPEDLGHQLAVADLNSGQVTRLTDGRKKVPIVKFSSTGLSRDFEESFAVRGLPLFSADMSRIFYMGDDRGGVQELPTIGFYYRFQPMTYHLVSDSEEPMIIEEEIFGFGNMQRLDRIGVDMLYFSASEPRNLVRREGKNDIYPPDINGFLYDPVTDRLEAVFPGESTIGPAFSLPGGARIAGSNWTLGEKSFVPYAQSDGLDSSDDGTRQVFVGFVSIAGQKALRPVAFLVEGDTISPLFDAPETQKIRSASISGDGRWVAVTLQPVVQNPLTFWLLDLTKGTAQELPLSSLIEAVSLWNQ